MPRVKSYYSAEIQDKADEIAKRHGGKRLISRTDAECELGLGHGSYTAALFKSFPQYTITGSSRVRYDVTDIAKAVIEARA